MGTPAFDDDETAPSPCGCAACLERLRLHELVAASKITRLTSIHSPKSTRAPWTVYLQRAGAVTLTGQGQTEEAAIEMALHAIEATS